MTFNLHNFYDVFTFIFLENCIIKPYMSKYKLHYKKHPCLDLSVLGKQYSEKQDLYENYNPYHIQHIQQYQPLYKNFFEMNQQNFESFTLNHKYHIVDLTHVQENNEIIEKPIFIKFSPLLDPYRYMIGKYDVNDPVTKTLPSLNSNEQNCHPKLLTYHNASYIDSFFCFLTSIVLNYHHIVHGIDFYGSYLGIQDNFRVNVADDLEYIRDSNFFIEHIGKLFFLEDGNKNYSFQKTPFLENSRKNKMKLNIDNDDSVTNLDCDNLSDIGIQDVQESDEIETVYSKGTNSSSSRLSTLSSDSNSELNYSSEEEEKQEEDENDEEENEDKEEDEDEESDENSEEDDEIYMQIHDFPIQLICMEKCDGTLDDLFEKDEVDETTGASFLFQIVMILLIYQKMFSFTHNDLHTNNIMYINTDQEFLYYSYNKKHYKVPTYGKIFKIIDFGRAIFKFQGKIYCSDSFAKDGDAVTQYNCEPFMNSNRPRLEPNNSFDLCRLGSSLFDFVMDIDDEESELDELQKTIRRWCLDDNGKNVLYKKNGEERYPNFKLYKMIARSVHKHTPEAQLEFEYFKQFLVQEKNNASIHIDLLPSYIQK